ncbi:MAG: DUF4167 domain-containing protein [Alphaproteobacteria bacterium]|nr:DUF4167 domain-containing protein [Alphaproteobacteria bacterium]
MRQGPHQKRGRGRGNRRPNTPNRNQTFDSNGPDVRIRGNASQVYEKYLALGRDASASGDRVLAESYFQHADHYYRIVSTFAENEAERQNRNNGQQPSGGARDWNDDDEDDREDQRGGHNGGSGNRDERRSDRRGSDEPSSDDRDDGQRERAARSEGPRGDASQRNAAPRESAPSESAPRDTSPRDEAQAAGDPGDGVQEDAPPPRRPRGRPRRAAVSEDAAPAVEEDGIRRTLRVAAGKTEAPQSEATGEEEQPRPRRRRRTASADQPANTDDDGAAAAS